MVPLFLLVFGIILSTTSGLNLTCTNDFDTVMSCHFDAQNCTEHTMALHNPEVTENCSFSPCVTGCCCSIQMIMIYGETFTANVLKRGLSVHSQTINITDTIKPHAPSIITAEKSNGTYGIQWRTNTRGYIRAKLLAIVTYQKKKRQ